MAETIAEVGALARLRKIGGIESDCNASPAQYVYSERKKENAPSGTEAERGAIYRGLNAG